MFNKGCLGILADFTCVNSRVTGGYVQLHFDNVRRPFNATYFELETKGGTFTLHKRILYGNRGLRGSSSLF